MEFEIYIHKNLSVFILLEYFNKWMNYKTTLGNLVTGLCSKYEFLKCCSVWMLWSHSDSFSSLQVLKQKLKQRFPTNQVKHYDCHYLGVDESTGRKKVDHSIFTNINTIFDHNLISPQKALFFSYYIYVCALNVQISFFKIFIHYYYNVGRRKQKHSI